MIKKILKIFRLLDLNQSQNIYILLLHIIGIFINFLINIPQHM